MVVKRVIDGEIVRYIEYLEDPYRPVLPRRPKEVTVEQDRNRRRLVLEHGFFVDCGLTYDVPLTVESITYADPIVVTSTDHGLSNGDLVKFRNMGATTDLENFSGEVANVTANTFEVVGIDSTGFGVYTSGGTVREEIMTVAGLEHLEGETLSIMADGTTHPAAVVTAGEVELVRRASIIHLGLEQKFYGETQRFIGGARIGTDQGQRSLIRRAAIILHNTMGGAVAVGPDFEEEDLPFRFGDDELDQSPPIFTGVVEVAVPGGWNTDTTIYFENTEPYPMTVLAIMPRAETNER
jgi:hypothetical protein